MAVTKLWAVHNNLWKVLDYAANPKKTDGTLYSTDECQDLTTVMDYAMNEDKTEKRLFVSGINCYPDIAREQFITVKQTFAKTDKVQAYHGYMSFKAGEVTPEQAHQIGLQFAQEVWGDKFQVIVATHLNTGCLHNHFVINSVSYIDGKKLDGNQKLWKHFHHIADRICDEHKLSVVEEPQFKKQTYYQNKMDMVGMPTAKSLARAAIDEAIENSHNLSEIKRYLNSMGYEFNCQDNHKYWTILPKGHQRPYRTDRLGENYTRDRIVARLMENDFNGTFHKFQPATFTKSHKYDAMKVKGSLYNLYLYYCYLLGYFNGTSQRTIREHNRTHYLLRDDIMKVDKISQEARLLGEHHIDTDQQLFSYKQSLVNRKEQLLDLRKSLYKEKRNPNTSEVRLLQIKDQLSEIKAELKKIYSEISLCDDIAIRSDVMQENIEQIEAEENSKNNDRKEANKNEFIR